MSYEENKTSIALQKPTVIRLDALCLQLGIQGSYDKKLNQLINKLES